MKLVRMCAYACMHACMYVSMYVCLDVCMYVWAGLLALALWPPRRIVLPLWAYLFINPTLVMQHRLSLQGYHDSHLVPWNTDPKSECILIFLKMSVIFAQNLCNNKINLHEWHFDHFNFQCFSWLWYYVVLEMGTTILEEHLSCIFPIVPEHEGSMSLHNYRIHFKVCTISQPRRTQYEQPLPWQLENYSVQFLTMSSWMKTVFATILWMYVHVQQQIHHLMLYIMEFELLELPIMK
jgi:hypothetical protein